MSEPICPAKHTKYDPTEGEFKCPKCGAKPPEFYIDESPEEAHADCVKLHPGDNLCCTQCGYGTSGQAFANRIVKQKNLKPCPHCNGKGLVAGDK